MYVFVYMVFCDSTLESVVDKLNNMVIKERKFFLQFIFFYFNTRTLWEAEVVTWNRSRVYFDII